MKNAKYLRYIIIHKWFVMLACFRFGLYWRGIIHDWSKFLPSEWGPYSDFFYGKKVSWGDDSEPSTKVTDAGLASFLYGGVSTKAEARKKAFDRAWLKHQHRNSHHWQHWVLREDSGAEIVLEMPERDRLEMLADWEGAGRAITGKAGGTAAWYLRNRGNMRLHPTTRLAVEDYLGLAKGVAS